MKIRIDKKELEESGRYNRFFLAWWPVFFIENGYTPVEVNELGKYLVNDELIDKGHESIPPIP